jgi:hypothetical protein
MTRPPSAISGLRRSVLALGCLLLAVVVAAPAAATLRAANPQPAATPAAVPDQPTALAVTAQAAPRYVRGSDDRTHIDYDLLITNWLPGTVTLRSINVLTRSGTPLLELTGDELAAHTHLVSGAPPTAAIPASATVATIIDVALPQGTVPAVLTHRISYDLPADLNPALRALIGSLEVDAPVLAVDRRTPTVIAAPLQGPGWFNAVGCCLPTLHRRLLYPANGTWVKGETFAIDWQQSRDGALFEGDGSRNSQWFGFGAPLLAVADGTVVTAVDGKPDIAPGASPILASPEDFAGNQVTVRIRPGVFATYGHLLQGSVQVRVGQHVRAGQQLGRLGNSGNTTAPHLHFGLVDQAEAVVANAVPFEIDHFRFVGVADPQTGQITGTPRPMRRTYPLVFTVTDFD